MSAFDIIAARRASGVVLCCSKVLRSLSRLIHKTIARPRAPIVITTRVTGMRFTLPMSLLIDCADKKKDSQATGSMSDLQAPPGHRALVSELLLRYMP